MVFDPNSRCLIIFSGMGDDDHYLSDMYSYDIDTNTATQLFVNFASSGGPDKNSTQRAVIDSSLQEIYVFVFPEFTGSSSCSSLNGIVVCAVLPETALSLLGRTARRGSTSTTSNPANGRTSSPRPAAAAMSDHRNLARAMAIRLYTTRARKRCTSTAVTRVQPLTMDRKTGKRLWSAVWMTCGA